MGEASRITIECGMMCCSCAGNRCTKINHYRFSCAIRVEVKQDIVRFDVEMIKIVFLQPFSAIHYGQHEFSPLFFSEHALATTMESVCLV